MVNESRVIRTGCVDALCVAVRRLPPEDGITLRRRWLAFRPSLTLATGRPRPSVTHDALPAMCSPSRRSDEGRADEASPFARRTAHLAETDPPGLLSGEGTACDRAGRA